MKSGAAAAAVLALAACAAGCSSSKCTASNCKTGCCDSAGTCQPGTNAAACGAPGASCAVCSAAQSCAAGTCVADGGVADGGGPGADIDALCANFLQAFCTFATRCGFTAAQDSCSAAFAPFLALQGCFFREKQAVRHGRADFDSAGAASCFAALESTASCIVTAQSTIAGCPPGAFTVVEGFITGKVAAHDYCYFSGECQPGLYCTSDSTAVCPGTCEPFLDAGAAATSGVECAPGNYLFGGVCSPFVPNGGSCSAGETCVADDFCDSTLLTCQPLRVAGQPCSPGACSQLLSCPATTMLCSEPQGVGAPCDAIPCLADLACVPTVIDGGAPFCRERGDAGAPCLTPTDCAAGFSCEGASATSFGACGVDVGLDAPCAIAGCAARLYCTSSMTCAVQGALWAACDPTVSTSCLGPWACALDGGVGQCVPPAGQCFDTAP